MTEDGAAELNTALLTEPARLDLAYVHLATADEDILLRLRKAWPGTLIVSPTTPGGPQQTGMAEADLWLGLGADLIAFGRGFLANPDLVERLRAGLTVAQQRRKRTSRDHRDALTWGRSGCVLLVSVAKVAGHGRSGLDRAALAVVVSTRRVVDAADGWLAVECRVAPVVVVGVEEVRQGFGTFGVAGVRAHVRPFVEQGAIEALCPFRSSVGYRGARLWAMPAALRVWPNRRDL